MAEIVEFATPLLNWYDQHHRELPWRINPRDAAEGTVADPYRVWLSEIMLQQTTVQAVKSYFNAFVAKWPSVSALAEAEQDDVMKAWAGLGYYSRARNLKKCAEIIAIQHGGQFPKTAAELITLPGIGPYTAAAIAAIAFGERVAVVDGNIERVISRYFTIETPLPAAKIEITTHVDALTPQERPGDFAQAMMDLGATICTPKRPACALCPLNEGCLALDIYDLDPERFPVKPPKTAKPVRRGAAFVAQNRAGSVYLTKRPDRGLLAGMSQVPTTQWTARNDGATEASAGPFQASWNNVGTVVHVFTHFELRLTVFHAEDQNCPDLQPGWWVPVEDLSQEALPTVMKKAISAAIPHAFKTATGDRR